MENVTISYLRKEDIHNAAKLIAILHNKLIETRSDIFLNKEQNWEKYLESRQNNEDNILLVACVDNEVVGVCEAEVKRCGDNDETKIRDVLFVTYIAVDERYQRLKIGTRLLEEIKKWAKENKINTLELNVWGFNDGAIKFYEANKMIPKRIVYEYFIDKE